VQRAFTSNIRFALEARLGNVPEGIRAFITKFMGIFAGADPEGVEHHDKYTFHPDLLRL
jgi:hypothetical protein